jgi:cell division septal protein FtsQ
MTRKIDMAKEEKNSEAKSSINPLPWIAGAILVLGMAVLGGLYWSSMMTVNEVRFEGNYFVSTEDLEKVDVPTGLNPDSINFADIRNRFERIPYVKQADISVQPSGNLMIRITERQPIAQLADGDRKIYIDQDGMRMPMILGKTVDVPILYGFSAAPMNDTLKSEAYKIVSDFLVNVRNNPVSDATISEVAWTRTNGVVALTNQNGVKLIFGKGNFATRLRNWEAFYGEIIKQKGIEKMQSGELRIRGQLVTLEE